jgi:glyoxylase-like metal-dependent hydrolase (beta-lactamase superfamily II)
MTVTNPNQFTRRDFLKTSAVVSGAAMASIVGLPVTNVTAQQNTQSATIHRFTQSVGFPVNAYIIEGESGLVVVDSTLTVTDSTALRTRIDESGKPLLAVLLTHPHPDHYAGLGNVTAGLDVPIIAVSGVNEVVRRDDDSKNELIGQLFGEEWPANRVFPNQVVSEGDVLDFGEDLTFDVLDIGPAESFHDSAFIYRGTNQVFAGDLAYGLMHAYTADNTNDEWRLAIERLMTDLPENTILYIGHGLPVTPGFLQWQRTYLDKFEEAIKQADWSDPDAATATVVAAMQQYLPNDDLLFLMELSIEPNARRLGKL